MKIKYKTFYSLYLCYWSMVLFRCPELLAGYSDLLLRWFYYNFYLYWLFYYVSFRKSPYSKKFTSEEVDEKLNNLVCFYESIVYITRKQPLPPLPKKSLIHKSLYVGRIHTMHRKDQQTFVGQTWKMTFKMLKLPKIHLSNMRLGRKIINNLRFIRNLFGRFADLQNFTLCRGNRKS